MSRRMYLDASALVKFVLSEPASESLRRFLAAQETPVTSRIATVEVPRAIRRAVDMTPDHEMLLATLWEVTTVLEVDPQLAHAASSMDPPTLRSLDAIHLATAMSIGDELEAVITYDTRLADAARAQGLNVVALA